MSKTEAYATAPTTGSHRELRFGLRYQIKYSNLFCREEIHKFHSFHGRNTMCVWLFVVIFPGVGIFSLFSAILCFSRRTLL